MVIGFTKLMPNNIFIGMNEKELKQKLISDRDEAKRIIEEFKAKMAELCKNSLNEYGDIRVNVWVPVEVEWRDKTQTFIDPETGKEMYNYWLSEIKVRPDMYIIKL
jgi:hypothetical protein